MHSCNSTINLTPPLVTTIAASTLGIFRVSQRIQHIDIAKGISILLVAIAHSKLGIYFPEFIEHTSLFRMPLFFLLSGVFFSHQVEPRAFLVKKSEALLKPYFAVLLALLLGSAITGDDAILWYLKGILYGSGSTIHWEWVPLWFLTHLFAVYLFTYILFHFLKFHSLPLTFKVATLFTFMLIGTNNIQFFWHKEFQLMGFSKELPGLPFSLDILFISFTFFICGSLLRDLLIRFKPNTTVLLVFLTLYLLISSYTGASVNLNRRVYDSPVFATLGAFIGIYIVLSISWYMSNTKSLHKLLLHLGEASLFVLIFHLFIQEKSFFYLSKIFDAEAHFMAITIVSLLLSVSIPLGIKWITLRSNLLSLAFFPFKSNKLLQQIWNASIFNGNFRTSSGHSDFPNTLNQEKRENT